MKELTGGEIIKYRLLNQNEYHEFKPMFKLHIMCNNLPKIDGGDEGVKRRVRALEYKSEFVCQSDVDEDSHKYLLNTTILEKFENDLCKMEYMRYILEHFDFDWTYTAPPDILEASKSYIRASNKVDDFIQEYLIKDPNRHITLKEIRCLIKSSEYYRHDIPTGVALKSVMSKALKVKCIPQKYSNGENKTNVYVGYGVV